MFLYLLTSCLSSWCRPPGVPTPLLEPTRPLPTLPPRRHHCGDTATSERKHSPPALPGNGKPNICDGNFDTVAVLRREMFVFKVRRWPQSEQGRKLEGDWTGGCSPGVSKHFDWWAAMGCETCQRCWSSRRWTENQHRTTQNNPEPQ